MQKQEFLTLVEGAINALEKQGKPSVNLKSQCKYQYGGLCCIVGHMMPENIRSLADEQSSSGMMCLRDTGFEWTTQFTDKQISLLIQLQNIHDGLGRHPLNVDFAEAISNMRESLGIYNITSGA